MKKAAPADDLRGSRCDNGLKFPVHILAGINGMLPLLKECHHTCMTLSIVRHPKPEFTVSRVSTKTGCNGKITHPGVSTAAWVVGSSPTGAPGHPVRQDTWDLMGYCAWHCCLADGGRDPSTSPFPLSDALFLRASPDHPEVHQAHTQFVGNDYGIPDCDGCTPFLCVPSLPSFPVSYRFAPHAQKNGVQQRCPWEENHEAFQSSKQLGEATS